MAWKEFEYSCISADSTLSYRPYIRTILHGKEALQLLALIDSGCETTMINIEVAALIGIELTKCKRVLVAGVGKGSQKGYQTEIDIEIPGCNSTFASSVIFADIPTEMLLGQESFFKNFQILFEGNENKFKLNKITRLKNAN